MTKTKANKLTWPVWFPYPTSWLKSIFIAFLLGIIGRIIVLSGNIGYKIASWANSPSLFIIVSILILISPVFIITFIHHIFHILIKKLFPKIQSPEMRNVEGFIPGIISFWEGLYGWLVIWLSSLIAFFLTILTMPMSRIELYNLSRYYSNYEQTLTTVFGVIWIITGALIYQVDFLVKKRLLSISLANISGQKEPQIDPIDPIDLEMDKLKGDHGLTEMKNPKRSPINLQISTISQPENYFEQGINLAKNAAQLTRNAKTKTDWYQVGITWTKTIEILKKVPTSDPNYEAAQQKIIDYQKYINYARKAVDSQNIN
jgi:hypothetical protein